MELLDGHDITPFTSLLVWSKEILKVILLQYLLKSIKAIS